MRYKSILFTLFKDKLLDGSKTQTYRVNFIPIYEIVEIVKIDFKEGLNRETLFLAEIIELYPKQIKDLTLEEAIRDGFTSIGEFQKGIMRINKVKSKNRWGFITRFKKCATVLDYLTDKKELLEKMK